MIYSIAILIILYYHNRRHWRVRVDLGCVLAALRANKYAQTIKAQPRQRLKPLRALSSRLKWQTDHWANKEPLASKIIRKGPKLLEEIKPNDGEEKGRRTITWKQFRGLEGAIADKIMLKVETLETASETSKTEN